MYLLENINSNSIKYLAIQNLPRFWISSLEICVVSAVGAGGRPRCGAVGVPGYHAQPGVCPLNIRNLS